MELLRESAWEWGGHVFGIPFHSEGGMAMRDRQVQRLVREGLVVFKRMTRDGHSLPAKKFTRDFYREVVLPGHLHGNVNRTRGIITPKGREVLAAWHQRNAA